MDTGKLFRVESDAEFALLASRHVTELELLLDDTACDIRISEIDVILSNHEWHDHARDWSIDEQRGLVVLLAGRCFGDGHLYLDDITFLNLLLTAGQFDVKIGFLDVGDLLGDVHLAGLLASGCDGEADGDVLVEEFMEFVHVELEVEDVTLAGWDGLFLCAFVQGLQSDT